MNDHRCICPGCQRTPADGQSICGRCSRYVPVLISLAIHDHYDAYEAAPEDFRPFILFCWKAMVTLAAWEATRCRYARRALRDPDDPRERPYCLTPAGGLDRART